MSGSASEHGAVLTTLLNLVFIPPAFSGFTALSVHSYSIAMVPASAGLYQDAITMNFLLSSDTCSLGNLTHTYILSYVGFYMLILWLQDIVELGILGV